MDTLIIQKIGDSLGIILPKDALDKLNLKEGDRIFIHETTDGIELTTYDPDFEKAMAAYRLVNTQYSKALRELAQ